MKPMKISEANHKTLTGLKEVLELRSLDEVVSFLVKPHKYPEKSIKQFRDAINDKK